MNDVSEDTNSAVKMDKWRDEVLAEVDLELMAVRNLLKQVDMELEGGTLDEEMKQQFAPDGDIIFSLMDKRKKNRSKRVSLLICPAQFCVPDDYSSLIGNIQSSIAKSSDIEIELGMCKVAPLPRTEWIKVGKQLPTQSFILGSLDCEGTLDWYFNAIEDGLSDIYRTEGVDANVAIIGHSIGGWIARAYLVWFHHSCLIFIL